MLQLDKDDESCILPSVVAFVGGDPVSVSGNEAVELRSRFPRCAVSNVKRFMGRKPMDPEVQDLVNLTAAQLQQSKGSEVRFSITRKDGNIASYGVLEVASLLFSHLRVQCKRVSGIDASRAVVTVPGPLANAACLPSRLRPHPRPDPLSRLGAAYYTSNQRAVTRRAAEMAGFEVIRLIAEPTAASVAYGLDIGGDRRVLVADLGYVHILATGVTPPAPSPSCWCNPGALCSVHSGGTFDVSILNVREGGTEVLVTEGDSMLGA